AMLEQTARRHNLTLNTLVQSAWAILLSRYSGSKDVVFGATVSGRPPDLPGVETMVGLFINILPVRAQVDSEQSLVDWATALQEQQLEMREYEYSPLTMVQDWSEVPRRERLFESLIIFENYPVDASLFGAGSSLRIEDAQSVIRTSYPLTLIAVPGKKMTFTISYDNRRFDARAVGLMLNHFERLIQHIASNPHQRLSSLYPTLQAEPARFAGPLEADLAELKNLLAHPADDLRGYVVDGDLQPVPPGVPGELCISVKGGVRCKTGKLARCLYDGAIEILGGMETADIGGTKVYLAEIESLIRQHPSASGAAVFLRQDGSSEARVVACVVERPGRRVKPSALAAFLRNHLPTQLMLAAFAVIDQMPLRADGSPDREALAKLDYLAPDWSEHQRAPRNPVEMQLVKIWREVMGIEHIGVTDNFFDLGGHSLMAVSLLAEVQKRTGQQVPLSTLVASATIEQLAAILLDGGAGVSKGPLVPIQPHGSRPPFFCMHPGSGNVLCYLPLAQRLGLDQPFYGLQDPKVLENPEHQTEADFETPLEEMVAGYVEAIRSVQPSGPYFLGGWSFGGFVAYEAAQQLRRRGQDVALLAILDTGPVARRLVEADDAHLLAILCGESGLTITPEEIRRFGSPADQLLQVVELAKKAGLVPAGLPSEWMRRSISVFKGRLRVINRYQMRPYAGRIALFRAREVEFNDARESQYLRDDPAMGWGKYTTEPVIIHPVDGNHASLGREPYVQTLAEKLGACLSKAGQVTANNSHSS
ncbi:MAG TPA: condensation domain-containing protein, partial [Blastocatellia bacterium]|nr:condensation domain-containing protein [Blastocatellia bacterium]